MQPHPGSIRNTDAAQRFLRACYFGIDKQPITEVKMSLKEREALKVLLKKIKGTDVELLLQESGLIER